MIPPGAGTFRNLLAVFLIAAGAAGAASPSGMAEDFVSPPDSARPWVWAHWLHGNVDEASITSQLEAIKRVGLGGVTMFDVAQEGIPPGPCKYLDERWQEMFAFEIAEAKRIGLEVMSQNGPGYSGNGGPWITPEFASQKIVDSATRVPGGRRFSGILPQPAANGGYYRDVAVLAVREPAARVKPQIEDFEMKRLVWLNYIRWKGSRSAPLDSTVPADACIPREHVIDLTNKMSADGRIDWDVPSGVWTVLRFGHTWTGQKTLPATPEGEGPECDKLDKRGIRSHFEHVMKRMVRLAGPEAGKTFHTFFMDSWEAGGQNWTERMPEEFKRRRGYDIVPFLPVLAGRVIGDLQTSERFLYDLRQTVSELMVENFWAETQRLCHSVGMKLAVQPYITTGNDLDAANFTDEPMGEFWSHPFQPNDYSITVKAASSVANLNGHRIVGAEAFTASEEERWLAHPATLKAQGDRMFCLGANRFQIHRFAMQRFPRLAPGMTMGKWGQHYDSTQTWWEWTKPWHDYLARCQYMLRQGPVVTDVLALLPEEPLHRFEHKPIRGYDYDACGPDNFKRIEMIGGKPGIRDGPVYQLITVDHLGTMTLERLRKLRDLVTAGAALLGEPPLATPGLQGMPQADGELKSLAMEIWGGQGESDRRLGKGRVFRGITADEALALLDVEPDFTGPQGVNWIHRRTAGQDIYFLASSSDKSITASCEFRVTGRRAELWDPETGGIRSLDLETSGEHSRAEIPLGPDGSVFVVFGGDLQASAESTEDKIPVSLKNPVPLDGRWTLEFPRESGVSGKLALDGLACWSANADPAVRHFSGTAVYSRDIDIPDGNPSIILDLGRVEVMARVWLNGTDMGILWKKPYRMDISSAAKPGRNHLEIEVVNLWVNRLIGDAAMPDDSGGERDGNGRLTKWPTWVLEGKSSPTGRRTFVTYPLWKMDEPLQASGLLGPVTLSYAERRTRVADR
jgi:hypothetical protein